MDLMEPDEVLLLLEVIRDLEDAERQAIPAVRRNFLRENCFNLSDRQFKKCFRLTKDLTNYLIDVVSPYIEPPTRVSALNVETKVLVALRFFGLGSYQEVTGSNIYTNISQPSVCRSIKQVCGALNEPQIMNQWIYFPRNIPEMEALRDRFFQKYHFPGIIGCIDCTHVAIVRPTGIENPEHIYVNRKGYHSINVQLVCDENLKIMNVNARFPGSTHDTYIWNQSRLSTTMEQIYRRNLNNPFFLIGDSGYPHRPWLMIPISNPPPGSPQENFNTTFCSIRSTIERCNGVLKNRFRCLLKHRVLHYSPHTASKIINACSVLHNICIENGVPEPEIDFDINEIDWGMHQDQPVLPLLPQNRVNPDLLMARHRRQQIVQNYFN